MQKKPGTSEGKKIKELEVSVSGGLYQPAEGRIKGNKILIDALGVTSVRYGWKPLSSGNLVNEAGLPASTFKIDVKK